MRRAEDQEVGPLRARHLGKILALCGGGGADRELGAGGLGKETPELDRVAALLGVLVSDEDPPVHVSEI